MTIDVAAAAELFIYGYPLVYCTDEIVKPAGPASTVIPGGVPFKSFGMARRLLDPEAKFVSPNNDTLYVMAPLDLSGGPLLLHTPDTGSRYYVLQFVDAWSNNAAYVGRRASGTAAADWLIAPSGFNGEVPLEATVVEVPSNVAVIVGRVQVDGEADLPAVHALQDQFTLSPLPGSTAQAGVPAVDSQVPEDLMFWERFRVYVRRFPPPAADREFVDMAAAAGHGVEPGTWTSALHMFDYNLDRCRVGTIDTPDWKIPDRKKAYVTRAVAARAGLWGNHGYEAHYEIIH